MQQLFYTPVRHTFHAECYHYETRYYTTRDDKGNTVTRSETHRVVTHIDSEEFRYYSWRDTSGLFLLDTQKFLNKEFKKAYIKLNLNLIMDMNDLETKSDYEFQKTFFYNKNRWRDVHMDFRETTRLDGMNQYNMIRVSDYITSCISARVFALFTFLPLIEFYKTYVDMFCETQEYTIKKLVSTRYNLNLPVFTQTFEHSIPKLVIYGNEQLYNHETTLMSGTPFLPTEDDINSNDNFKNMNTHKE
jgi:hypothetical protein